MKEVNEDANNAAVLAGLTAGPSQKPKVPAAPGAVTDSNNPKPKKKRERKKKSDQTTNPTVPAAVGQPKAKAKAKPKAKAKAKGGDNTSANPQAAQPKSQSAPKKKLTPAEKAKIPCSFHAKGKCTRGDKCEYGHGNSGASSSQPRIPATVAVIAGAASAATGAKGDEVQPNEHSSMFDILKFSARALPSLRSLVRAAIPALVAATSHTLQQTNTHIPALVAHAAPKYSIEVIGDTGAGRCLGSVDAFCKQGVPKDVIKSNMRDPSESLIFDTGGGEQKGVKTVAIQSKELGSTNFYLLKDCPLALSIGLQIAMRRAFIWCPDTLPYIVKDPSKLRIWCPEDNRIYASKVEHHVPIFNCDFKVAPGLVAKVIPEAAEAAPVAA